MIINSGEARGGGGSPTLQTKTKTYTPTNSQQTEQITADTGYDGLQEVDVAVEKVVCANLTAANIKKDVVVKVGTPTDDDSVMTVTGTFVGGTKLVQGTFTTGSAAGNGTVNLNYTGTGYPIAAIVYVDGGVYNSAITGWYNSVQRYAVGQWTMTKSVMTSTPTYTTSGNQNAGVTTSIYKNSTSSSTSYTRTSAMATNVFSSSNAANGAVTCVRLKSATSLSYYVNTSSYGLLPSTKYAYIIIYSS